MNINWRAAWISVGVTLVVGWILSIPIGIVVNMLITQAQVAGASPVTELAGLMAVVNLGLACVFGLLFGAAIAAIYVRFAGRGVALAGGEAVTGALVSLGLAMVIGGVVGLCASATGTLLSLQQVGSGMGPVEVGQVFGAVLVSSLLTGLVRLIAGGLAAVPTALVMARLVQRG